MSGSAVLEQKQLTTEQRAAMLKEHADGVNNKSLSIDQRAMHLCRLIDLRAPELLAGVDARVDKSRIIEAVKMVIREKSELCVGCTLPSVMRAAKVAVMSGLKIGGFKHEVDFIPRNRYVEVPGKSKKQKIRELCADPNYRGLIHYVGNTGKMKSPPFVEAIFEGEKYEFTGDAESMRVQHTKDPLNQYRRKVDTDHILAIYVRWHLDSGTVDHIMTWEQILEHRDKYSRGYQDAEKGWGNEAPKKNSTWHTELYKMALKTVIRDAVNRDKVPVSDVDRGYILEAQRAEAGMPLDSDVIDAEFTTDAGVLDDDEHAAPTAGVPSDPAPDHEALFDRYVEDLARSESVAATGAAYDAVFGPDSAIIWPPGFDARAAQARNDRNAEIRAKQA